MPLAVIGAGLGRTGTASLKLALEQLLGGRCYHMSEAFSDPANPPLWLDAARGKPNWDRIFRDYVACVDYPACGFWRELSAYYPKAKVLLSVRDPDKWFESTRETILSEETRRLTDQLPDKEFFDVTVNKDFIGHFGDRAFMTDYFRRHVETVKQAIPKERLLVYEVGEGWEPLCKFLGMPVPKTPFPQVNAREEFARTLEGMQKAVEAGGSGREEIKGVHRK
ncbi:MAG TPA: sulfotransferase [Alphaproteobacteria bacterium]|nr:sulfotransferase [Alphaproteobacteria bacterium]